MPSRRLGDLTAPEIPELVRSADILCTAFGSFEQHGPHLPVSTDALVSARIAELVVERFGEEYGLWLLPPLPFGYSPEHAWAPGCIGLDLNACLTLLASVCSALRRATPARRLLIVNGHGGNRPVLEAALYEIERDSGIHVAVSHPSALAGIPTQSPRPEIHAGKSETSVVMVIAPDLVRRDRISSEDTTTDKQETQVRAQLLDRGTTVAWSSGDPALSSTGVFGDPTGADLELGQRIVSQAVENHRRVLDLLQART